jgi:Polyketide cyclase / dehydrase and lipid transport
MSDVESVERVIPASAEEIFALISNPLRHHEMDGSGTVREAKNVPSQLTLGSKFGMNMKLGIPYSMINEVIEFEPNRLIAWQTRPPLGFLAKFVGGRIWRYELEPVDGGTRVRESWDLSQEAIKAAVRPLKKKTIAAMTKTLEQIERIVTAK